MFVELLTTAIALLVAYGSYTLIGAWSSPLRRIPGPWLARYTRFWYLREIIRGSFEKTNIALHRSHGSVVRVTPNEYSIDDPDAVKILYGQGNNFIKSPWYYASGNADRHKLNLFSERDPKLYATGRRKVANLYSMTVLLKIEPIVSDHVQMLVEKSRGFAEAGEVIDLGHWLQCYAFDVIGQLTLGQEFGFLEKGEDKGGILSAIDFYLHYCAIVGVISEWHPLIQRLLQAIAPKEGGFPYMVSFCKGKIQEKLENSQQDGENQQDFLSQMLRMEETEKRDIDKDDIFVTCFANIGAGSDTTAISFNSVFYHLAKDPATLRKLRTEIDEKLAAGQLSSPPTFAETQKMPYLQAVVKEALRMHPATGLPLGRIVPSGGATIAGYFFPAGTVVGINSWVAHRNTSVFGDNANIFKPERWLQDSAKVAELDRYFMAFGMGSRTCIGKNISLMEIQKTVPHLVRYFDFEIVPEKGDWTTKNIWFVKQQDFRCRIRMRAS